MGISRTVGALLRRDSVRHSAVRNRTILAWWDGAVSSQFQGTLKDVSLSGALLVVHEEISPPTEVCIRMEEPVATEWVHATIVGSTTSHHWRLFRATEVVCQLRLKFPEACPYDFFKAATHGDAISNQVQKHVSKEFDSHTWR